MPRRSFLLLLGAAALPAFAFLCIAQADDQPAPVRALLVIGGGYHDYAHQKDVLTKGISARANVQWAIAYDPNTGTGHKNPIYDQADFAKGFDVIVHDECTTDVKDPASLDAILAPHKAGIAGVILHCGMHSYRSEGWPKSTPWFDLTGLATTGHGPQVPITVTYSDKDHAITKGLEDWTTINEELYNNLTGKLLETAQPLARGKQTIKQGDTEKVEDCIVAWTNTYAGKTRVFGTTLGHNTKTVEADQYLDLVARGLLWSVNKLDAEHLKPAKKVLLDEPSK